MTQAPDPRKMPPRLSPAPLPPIRHRPRFAAPRVAPPGLWRRVPAAIFLPLSGALALAVAWTGGVAAFALPPALAQLFAGMIAALTVFALTAYGVKLARRPGVVVEELAVLPGHAGIAAAVISVELAALAVGNPVAGRALLGAGLLLHLALIAALLAFLRTAAPAQRRPNPAWQLSLGGLAIPALVAARLGWPALAAALAVAATTAALLIGAAGLRQALTERIPAPLRPMLVLHLIPLAALSGAALALGLPQLGAVLAMAAGALLLTLAVSARWLLAGGFSALWGALCPALGVTALAWVMLWQTTASEPVRLIAGLTLAAASLVVLPLLALIWRDWAQGRLAFRTNAAIA